MHPENKKLAYTLRRSNRARRMRLAVYCDGSVVVTTPPWLQQSIIEKFIADKKQWIINKIDFFKSMDRKPVRIFSDGDYLKHKNEVLTLVLNQINEFNKDYGFSFNRISIRNQKTRWGSCSKNRNLNINYKIIFLPKRHRDYIIVHELCHLREFNHSHKFWSLVEEIIPDYSEIRKELRKNELFYK